MRRLALLLAILQAIAGTRVAWRLLATARGERIASRDEPRPTERVSVIVPVLNEEHRLWPCLEGLLAQPPEVVEILVVDGGSVDGTPGLVTAMTARDPRLRLIDASPVPDGWNGKAYGLHVGLQAADTSCDWILTVDADVRVRPALVRSLLAQAARSGAAMIGVATQQHLSGPVEGLVHPALLTTLVYRFGIPGQATSQVDAIQANGQCSLIKREPLQQVGGFAAVRGSVCEDVTLARALGAAGHVVGFYESDDLAEVVMYESGHDAWRNWTRSLPLRDRYSGISGWLGLCEVLLAQGLPHAFGLLAPFIRWPRSLQMVNAALICLRLGMLAGIARAYPARPWTYWLSPVLDAPVAVALWQSALRREHTWRGRRIVRTHTEIAFEETS
jgi:dolichol-phosphate mannosyltransferase